MSNIAQKLFRSLALASLMGSLVGCATNDDFNMAMLATVSDLRGGDLSGASSSLQEAQSAATSDDQRIKVKELGLLIAGAESYCRGDRDQAGSTWSDTKSPEFRRALSTNQHALGVVLTSANKN
ncbi:MAG: hypothetical protein EXS01_05100 [Phycisphaerales bacterium]|nr:hypothetical protein [Phycisphaerales bacterium]